MPKQKAEPDPWAKTWDARLKALSRVLGKAQDKVFHAFIPFDLGGFADVLTFSNFVRGRTYVTADCTGPGVGQLKSRLGNYELMICTRKPMPDAADMISKLAPFTREARLQPGDTMEFPKRLANLKGFMFTHPKDKPLHFEFLGKRYGLLLCLGLTKDELALAKGNGSEQLLPLLKAHAVFPYSIFDRKSVLA